MRHFCFILCFSGWKTSSGGSSSMSKSNLSLHSLSNASHGCSSPKVVNVFQSADVFLLCYRISDPASLFSAINFWCPEIRCYAPTTPIILVGCQSDLRLGFHYFLADAHLHSEKSNFCPKLIYYKTISFTMYEFLRQNWKVFLNILT